MASNESTSPASMLRRLVPSADIRQAAFRLGFIKRVRKIDPIAFLVATVLTVGRRDGHSIAGLQRALTLQTGTQVVRSAFWDRLTEPFAWLVQWLLERLEAIAVSAAPTYTGLLRGFEDVVAVDATVVTLREALAAWWPGTRSQAPAAIKVHTQVRAVTGELLDERITGEREYETSVWSAKDWKRGVLYLFDRGYKRVAMWHAVEQAGGVFITRLSAEFRATIIGTHRKHRAKTKLRGKPVREVVARLKRKPLDFECQFWVRKPPHNNRLFEVAFRVVGVWNNSERRHHLYITNLPVTARSPEQIAQMYRLRWEVETFYKTAKGGLGLDQITSSKKHIASTMVRAALIRASLAMQCKCEAEQNLPQDRWINPGMWVRVWREVLSALAAVLIDGRRLKSGITWRLLAQLSVDPNRNRLPTRRSCLLEPSRTAARIEPTNPTALRRAA